MKPSLYWGRDKKSKNKLEIICLWNSVSPTISLSIRMISPGNLVTILYQLTKSQATSCNGFRDILITSFLSPNLQKAIPRKNAKGDNLD